MSIEDRVGLPSEYVMTELHPSEADYVITLREKAKWGTDTSLDTWQSAIDQSIATVGVFGRHGNLVGVGFLAGNNRHAVLCDLTVHPNHRNKGIVKAIVRRRVDLADQYNIPYLYTELAPTNTLKELYVELGFVATGNAFTRAARRHPSEISETPH